MQSASSESSVLTSWPRLLERRVSRFDSRADAVPCAELSDELRKIFMKLCVTAPLADYFPSLIAVFAAITELPAELEPAAALAAAGLAPSAFTPSRWISTLPLKYAPSSMATRWVAMSPTTI